MNDQGRARTDAWSDVSRAALDVVNRHRAVLGMVWMDPVAAGWSEQDVLDEAERIAKELGHSDACAPKSLRVKQTIYLSSDTRKLLRLRAVEDDCELSEAEDALGAYPRG